MTSPSISLALTRIGPWSVAFDAAAIDEVLDEPPAEDEGILDLAALLDISAGNAARKILRIQCAGTIRLLRVGAELTFREVPVERLFPLPSFLRHLVPPGLAGIVYGAGSPTPSLLIDSHRLEPGSCSTRSG